MNKYLFVFVCLMFNISVVYAEDLLEIQAPVAGELEKITSGGKCSGEKWCFNQHGTGGHVVKGGIGDGDSRANDSKAWDINLNSPNHDADNGKPVCAVADGTIYTGGQWAGKHKAGQILINHPPQDKKDVTYDKNGNSIKVWSSAYLHMKDIVKMEGGVKKGEVIGYISNVGVLPDENGNRPIHLHFAVYGTPGAFDATLKREVTLVSQDVDFTELSSCGDQVNTTTTTTTNNTTTTTTSSTPATILLPKLAVGEGVEAISSVKVRDAKITFNQVGTITKADKTTGKIICGEIDGTVGGTTYTFWYIQWDDGRRAWVAENYLTFEGDSRVKDSKVTANLEKDGYVNLREANLTASDTPIKTLPVSSIGTATCGGVRGSFGGKEYIWWRVKWADDTEGWSAQGDEEKDYLTRTTVSVRPGIDSSRKPVKTFGNNPTKLVFYATGNNECANLSVDAGTMSVRSNTDISFNLSDISRCAQKIRVDDNDRMILPPVGVGVKDKDPSQTTMTFFPFRDVEPTKGGAKAITTLWNLGIVDGLEGTGGDFGYNDNLTRTEFLKMALLARAKGETAGEAKKVYESLEGQSVSVEQLPFSDKKDLSLVSSWGLGYIKYAVEHDLMNGFEDKTFGPNANVTREQATKILTLTYCDELKFTKIGNLSTSANFKDEDDCMVRKTNSANVDLFNKVKCKDYKPFADADVDGTSELCTYISQAKETNFVKDWEGIYSQGAYSTSFDGGKNLKRWEMATSACRLYAKVAKPEPSDICTQ